MAFNNSHRYVFYGINIAKENGKQCADIRNVAIKWPRPILDPTSFIIISNNHNNITIPVDEQQRRCGVM